ncbi:hypothetical protein [Paludisphaera rhizosphaerae]|uniref:hypothetical protein n=1 Tax=Paludisphaera rhizosphaerae TaxID=2711216 RepID=UPI0013EA72A9|nr:hypothetical protein [Paludisphaera rhizosphaerae]
MKIGHLMLTLGVLATASASADDDDLPANVFADDPNDDVQTVLFLGPARPAVIRLRIQVDGLSHRARWDSLVRALIPRLDDDKDGALSRTEIARVDPFRGSRPIQSYSLARPTNEPVTDRSKISDPVDLFRPFAPPFSIQLTSSPEGPSINIFDAIDHNKDGRVDRDEAAAAATSLAILDADDDGTISVRELTPFRSPFVGLGGGIMVRDSAISARMTDLTAEGSPEVRARKILERYDDGVTRPAASSTYTPPADRPAGPGGSRTSRARDGKLDNGEIILGAEAFARIDGNGDGHLDRDEIERGLATDPDAELIVRIGKRAPGQPAIEIVRPVAPRPGGGVKLIALGSDGVVVDLETMAIEIRSGDDSRSQVVANRKMIYINQFQAADLDKNGVVDRGERLKAPALAPLISAADHDGDGRLTEAELINYVDLQAEVASLRILLQAIDQGTSLLDLVDVDRDHRIGVRELRALPEALRREDRDGDGYVGPREVARHYRWIVALSDPNGGQGGPIVVTNRIAAPTVPTFPTPPSAPSWFLKMDRNRDGDLSPREFLGPEAVFAAYDADHDGLISPAEAQRPPKEADGP